MTMTMRSRSPYALPVALLLLSFTAGASASAQSTRKHAAPVSSADIIHRDSLGHASTARRVADGSIDQHFLRAMADYYDGMRSIAHGRMMQPSGHASHGGQNDPAIVDGEFDLLQQQVLTMLSTLYREQYSPVMPKAVAALTKPDGTMASLNHEESQTQLAGQIRQGIATIDAFRNNLHRPEVRAIASKHRPMLAAWLTQIGNGSRMESNMSH